MTSGSSSLGAAGFWSYAHIDNESEGGRIVDLAADVRNEFRLLSGANLDVFLDRDDLKWGQDWRVEVDRALAGVTFFIPVMTPTFFERDECRREVRTFVEGATSLGVTDLILPILYADVPGFGSNSEDEIIRSVAPFQYEDWRELRLEDRSSPPYRKGVHKIAKRIVEIAETISSQPSEAPEGDAKAVLAEVSQSLAEASGESPEHTYLEDEGAPGLVEVLAEAEEAMPELTSTIEEASAVIEEIGAAAQEAAARSKQAQAAGRGYGGVLASTQFFASRLADPVARLDDLGTRYLHRLARVDAGYRVLIEMASQVTDQGEVDAACEFFRSIRELAGGSADNKAQMADLIATFGETATLARTLRPPLRKAQSGLRKFADGDAIIQDWVRAIDASPVDCTRATNG